MMTSVETRTMESAIRAMLDHHSDPALHQWVRGTMRAFETRLAGIEDPQEREEARRAAMVLIKTTLQEWSRGPVFPQ
ncbi:hypothetical protein NAC44_05835 [Allorhizobium sp. BGMRC 0089]|uniref:hypothetical protein n=1 Tax=Allorhizobium sonneratiae TaxID=2934936 RepID=UPI0020342749|nr:hypothetical protein [Allorhizobium sonneratiae]MCM2291846.1 hypothetical protein [Allorhizobium sonneratiae]